MDSYTADLAKPALGLPTALISRVAGLLDDGQAGAALLILASAAAGAPDDVRVLALLTRAALIQGRIADAVVLLDRLISADPDPASHWRDRGACHLALGRHADAARDAAEAVCRDPAGAASLSLLGRALFGSGQVADSRACLSAALAADPHDLNAMEVLAQAHAADGDEAAAFALVERTLLDHPRSPAPWRAAALLHIQRHRFAEAVAAIDDAGRNGALDACLLGLKGHALTCLGNHDDAGRAYAEALTLAPEDPYVRHLVASAGAAPPTERASPKYLRAVFDGYAARFDDHLIDLGYRIPGLLRAAVLRMGLNDGAGDRSRTGQPWLDLGCGTGLLAVALSDLGLGPVTGVDVSPAMLAHARAKGLYHQLIEADLPVWLAEPGPSWPLALAGDTFCYFGDLMPLLSPLASRMIAGGKLLFSVEATDAAPARGWSLGRGGRFSHAPEMVRQTLHAAGFDIVALDPATLRMEGGAPVAGLIAVAERRAVSDTLTARPVSDLPAGGALELLATGQVKLALPLLRIAASVSGASGELRLNHALAEAACGDRDRARAIMTRVAAGRPDWDEPFLRLAELFRSEGEVASAEQAYRAALARAPDRVEALVALGALLVADARADEAKPLLCRATEISPDRAEGWDALGRTLAACADLSGAAETLAEARRLAPADIGIALRSAEAAHAAGKAVPTLDGPGVDAVGFAARGAFLARAHRLDEAADSLEAAVALGAETDETLALLGGLQARLGRHARAESLYRRALELTPGAPDLAIALSTSLIRQHRFRAADRLLRDTVATGLQEAVRLCNLSSVETSLGRQDEAAAHAREAIALAPKSTATRRALLNVLPYRDGTTPADMLEAACACAATLASGFEAQTFANPPDRDRPLRIGLLSGGLRTHPVGWLTVAGFEALDPRVFILIAFAQGEASKADAIAARFRVLARGGWHSTDALGDVALASKIRSEQVDILIDLGGHGDHGRIGACAHRAAPVQVKWVGSQTHGTGLPAMDCFLTDAWESPPDAEATHTERLLRLRDGYVCYAPSATAPPVAPPPALARDHVTFGCFNNLSKVTPRVFDAWATILARVTNSRFVLKTHQLDEPETVTDVENEFRKRHIEPARIDCRGASPHNAHLGSYEAIDIALDPFPYVGGVTTIEALWMGVPTVTIAGNYFAARHSASHLSNAGLTDWITLSTDDYIARAVAAANDLPGLAALRAGLRTQVAASPLCDAARFGASLSAALRDAWQDWCDRQGSPA